MKDLENSIYKLINDNKKEICKNFIDKFFFYSKNSFNLNERKGALLGFYSIVKVVKEINQEDNVLNPNEIKHSDLFDEIKEKLDEIIGDCEDRKNDNVEIVALAAECLYNIMVSFVSYALNNLKSFLGTLLKLVTRNEYKIKRISEHLENALKSIINYSFQKPQSGYQLKEFFKLIIESLSLQNSDVRRLGVSLIICFSQIPNFQLINILHLFLSNLFELLKDKEVKEIAKKCLDNFYNDIDINFDDIPFNVEKKILEKIITKINSIKDIENLQGETRAEIINININVLKWIYLFLKKIRKKYFDAKDKQNTDIKKKEEIIENYFEIFIKIQKIIFDIFKNINDKNIKGLSKKDDQNDNDMSFNDYINEINNLLISIIKSPHIEKKYKKKEDFEKIITENVATENQYLFFPLSNWVINFFKIFEDAFSDYNDFIENFSFILNSTDENIFKKGIEVLSQMFDNKKLMKDNFIEDIIEKFLNKLKNKETEFINKRTLELIELLIKKIDFQKVYESFAAVLEKLNNSNNLEYVIRIINILNEYLLKSSYSEILKLKEGKINNERNNFFKKLFKTWSKNSISCLILCLIAEDFELSYNILLNLGKIDLTQDVLKEYSTIIQILESKEFTSKLI